MLSVSEVAVQRAQLWRAGFRPVPIRNAILGDKASGKAPLGEAWPTAARSDPPAAVAHPPNATALNTGILCDGLRAIDLDIDNPSIAAAATALAEEMLGEPLTRSRRGSARVLLLYRAASGEPRKLTLAGRLGKVEALGAGQQFVAFGTHWEHLAELEWSPHAPGVEVCEDLVAVSEPQVEGFLAAVAPLIDAKQRTVSNGADHAPADAQADALRIATALNDIPNAGAPDWEAWNNAGMAVWRATGGSDAGWEMFRAWSARHPAFDLAVTRERWEHYFRSPPDRIGAGSLFHLASEARAEARADAYHAPPPELESPPLEAPAAAEPFAAKPVDWDAMEAIVTRQVVYGHLLFRQFVSVLGAPGGTGKTAYAFAIAVAIATGREILGEAVHQPGNVWIYNLEDPMDELLRRLRAVVMHYGVERSELAHRLFLDSGRDRPLILAHALADGSVLASPMLGPLIEEIRRRDIRVLIVDPFVRSHRCIENRNEQIDVVAALWGEVAHRGNCSVLLVHHFRKGAGSDADAFRGASSLIDASRAALALSVMSVEEADTFNVPARQRWQYIRADNAKLNLAPPPERTTWLQLLGVPLGNGSPAIGDDVVQTVQRWSPASPWDDMPMHIVVAVLERLRAGPGDGEQFTLKRGNHDRWAGSLLVELAGRSIEQASAVLRQWVDSGLLLARDYVNHNRKSREGVVVDAVKLAEMQASESPSWSD